MFKFHQLIQYLLLMLLHSHAMLVTCKLLVFVPHAELLTAVFVQPSVLVLPLKELVPLAGNGQLVVLLALLIQLLIV